MSASKLIPSQIAGALQINERFGSLLRRERRAAGYSLSQVAEKFNLNRRDVKSWELGKASPPANIFFAIVAHFGSDSLHRAAELDLEVQVEKYNLILAARRSGPQDGRSAISHRLTS